jgi:hypothetical protein
MPFAGVPPNTIVGIQIIESENNEALAAITWPVQLAGVSAWNVPVLEMPAVGVAEVEKKLRG